MSGEVIRTPSGQFGGRLVRGFNVRILCSAEPAWPYAKPPAWHVVNVTLVPGEPPPKIPWNEGYPRIVAVEIDAVADDEPEQADPHAYCDIDPATGFHRTWCMAEDPLSP